MRITIVGAGTMGTAYGRLWAAAGHRITYTYSRSAETLAAAAAEAGPNAAAEPDAARAAAGADAVVLCVRWGQLDDALAALGPLPPGTLVVDAFTPLRPDLSGLEVGFTTSGAEILAGKLPDARVVMALQNTFAEVVRAADRRIAGQTPSMFFCGDDPAAKNTVAQLITAAGYEPVDAGPLAMARHLEPVCFFTVALAYGRGMGSSIGLKLLRPA